MMHPLLRGSCCCASLLLLAAACGGMADDADFDDGWEEIAWEDDALGEGPLERPAPFVLVVSDVDAYQRGMSREVELLRSAMERLMDAATARDTLAVLTGIQPIALRREGARSAGVPEERYDLVKSALNEALAAREMGGAMHQLLALAADTLEMPPELRLQARQNLLEIQRAWGDPYASLPPATAELLRLRADDIAEIRTAHLDLLTQIGR